MTTIDTIEDLLQVLDENPAWVEALRARLLTRELVELPEKFASFVARMDKFVAETNKFVAEMNKFVAATNKRFDDLEQQLASFVAEMGKFVAATNKRFDNLEQRLDKSIAATNKRFDDLEQRLDKSIAATNKRFDDLEQRLDKSIATTNKRFDGLEVRMQSIQDDVGILKGAHARSAAIREASDIARDMGLWRVKTLTQDDLWRLIDFADTADIPTNELRSFRRADLIMEATDQEGATCYIAVEISFTVNGRDTSRAVRNAGLLTKFSGQPAQAAVAGLRGDERIQGSIESGEVFWYQLDPEVLEAE